MNKINLEILTPYGKYLAHPVDYIEVKSEKYLLGILPNHAPLVSSLEISKMVLKFDGHVFEYAIGGGVIRIDKDKTTILLESVERSDEIDHERAFQAKKRAEARIENSSDVDLKRAKKALARAENRLRILASFEK
jgi:F-type H+-transporting ATPase subunit epsilon